MTTNPSAPAEVVQAPSWPPTEAQLNEWLATIVEAWWSAASATYIRSGKLQATDIRAKYALREIIRPWAEAAHHATRAQSLAADALDAGSLALRAADMLEAAIGEGYPVPAAKRDQCEHGKFGWEDCIACYDEKLWQVATAIRALSPANPAAEPNTSPKRVNETGKCEHEPLDARREGR